MQVPTQELRVLVIDDGHPDVHHPDFLDSDGESIILPLDAPALANHFEEPHGRSETYEPILELDGPRNLREKFTSWWLGRVANKDDKIGRTVQRELHPSKIFLKWFPLGAVASAGLSLLFKHDTHVVQNFLTFVQHHLTFASVSALGARWAVNHAVPYLASPSSYRQHGQQTHPTHVTGTLARGFSTKERGHITIYTADSGEVEGPVPDSPILQYYDDEPSELAEYTEDLQETASEILGEISAFQGEQASDEGRNSILRPHSFEVAAEVLLEEFYLANKIHFESLAAFIQENEIRAVNMSYGIEKTDLVQEMVKNFESQFGINAAPGTALGRRITDIIKNQYRTLFEKCPHTAFFLAAGNDADSIDGHQAVMELIDTPNLFISAATNDLLQLSSFSRFSGISPKGMGASLNSFAAFAKRAARELRNKGKTRITAGAAAHAPEVSSAGFGENRWSSYPGGGIAQSSGTSMASPENMLLYMYLISMEPELTVVEALDLLKRGVIRDESLKTEVASGGVTVAPRVLAEYLLWKAKKSGHFKDLKLVPLLHVLPAKLTEAREFDTHFFDRNQRTDSASVRSSSDRTHRHENIFHFTNLIIGELESFLDQREIALGEASQNKRTTALRRIEKEFREKIEALNRQQLLSEIHLVHFFEDAATMRRIFSQYEIEVPEYKETLKQFFNRVISPTLKTRTVTFEHLVSIVDFCRNYAELKESDLTYLHNRLKQAKIIKHYIHSVFTSIARGRPEFAAFIETLNTATYGRNSR